MILISDLIEVSDIRSVLVQGEVVNRVPQFSMTEIVQDQGEVTTELQGFDRLAKLHQVLSVFLNVVKAFEEK